MAVIASLAVAGLSACRSEPSVAAYVGDTRITEKQVERIADEAQRARAGAGATPIPRSEVVRLLVARPLLDQLAARHQVTLPANLPYDQYAKLIGLPADNELLHLIVDNGTLQQAVSQKITGPATLSDDDLRDVYQRPEVQKALPPGTSLEQFRSVLSNADLKAGVQAGIGLRNELAEVAAPLHVTINPRYQPLELVTYTFQPSQTTNIGMVGAPLGDPAHLPVSDVS
ncbi:hypothetical protein ACWT_0811 [Actinoplanes sp. SE50]|uniref:hypothetical protein n=1 Tax=unclassified Actinoplanes TaxID=2626549 RepID=UPI00023EC02B|nr:MULTISPECIES: hypothetical protein [unclassified Actinoplanes]AEV81825.1 hypothetical protein ACPL_928 [Actinoplanes sp. SE50/110]ATO80226.1 hypothetical protein ACWT_0811 [Actinoplanes sp. SE50]SLL97631.1 uncharacterized protein ACSP50_0838 [Actinoplanes sp. SE50/110]